MKLTPEMIFAGLNNGAVNSKQLLALGLHWPPQNGWIRRRCNHEISEEDYSLFLSLCKAKRSDPSLERAISKPKPYDPEIEAWL